MKCTKHPDYKLKQRPRSMCVVCWKAWALKLEKDVKEFKSALLDAARWRTV